MRKVAADEMIVLDLREVSADLAADVDWSAAPCTAVSVVTVDVPSERVDTVDRALRAGGFQRAGRAWGEAGTLRTYRRPSSLRERAEIVAAQTRVRGGELIVAARRALPDRYTRAVWRERLHAVLGRETGQVLDRAAGRPITPPQRAEVIRFIDALPESFDRTWAMSLEPDEQALAATVNACHDAHGVWPISFSYPRLPVPINEHPEQVIADIVPGFPYSFDDEAKYLATYSRAQFGLTHRKAGWDCFRHLEILAAGATPLMPDAADIPRFSMVQYPKQFFAAVVEHARQGGVPDIRMRQAVRDFFDRHLTTGAMARYVLSQAKISDTSRVVFVDERLPGAADYLSVLMLIGMKQRLGDRCEVMFPVDYIYDDTMTDTQGLYGRGFGYSRTVGGGSRTKNERMGTTLDAADVAGFDAVVVGSIARNWGIAERLLHIVPPSRTIWMHGEDEPPSLEQARRLTRFGAHVFVRALDPPTAVYSARHR